MVVRQTWQTHSVLREIDRSLKAINQYSAESILANVERSIIFFQLFNYVFKLFPINAFTLSQNSKAWRISSFMSNSEHKSSSDIFHLDKFEFTGTMLHRNLKLIFFNRMSFTDFNRKSHIWNQSKPRWPIELLNTLFCQYGWILEIKLLLSITISWKVFVFNYQIWYCTKERLAKAFLFDLLPFLRYKTAAVCIIWDKARDFETVTLQNMSNFFTPLI